MTADMQPALSASALKFIEHWKALSHTGLVPTLDEWLSELPVWIASHKFRAELLPGDALVLFTGSANIARRGHNNTGASLFFGEESRLARGLENLSRLVLHPCGLWTENSYGAFPPKISRTQTVVMPLRMPAGRWPQVVGFTDELTTTSTEGIGIGGRLTTRWIDIGAGVPTAAPV